MKAKINNLFYLITGICAIWLVADHILKFSYPDYFYNANQGIEYYVGVNVVSMLADFSFFTYHTIILFGVWCILYSISDYFSLTKLKNFTKHKAVITFLFTNYLVTTVLYTIFELTSGNITFGLYANTPKAIHNLGTNILGHYVFFIVMLVSYIKIKTCGVIKKKYFIYMSGYIFIYYIYVLITGRFMYNIEWYPYPIFDTFALFGKRLAWYFEIPILLVIAVIMTIGYYYVLNLINKLKIKDI